MSFFSEKDPEQEYGSVSPEVLVDDAVPLNDFRAEIDNLRQHEEVGVMETGDFIPNENLNLPGVDSSRLTVEDAFMWQWVNESDRRGFVPDAKWARYKAEVQASGDASRIQFFRALANRKLKAILRAERSKHQQNKF